MRQKLKPIGLSAEHQQRPNEPGIVPSCLFGAFLHRQEEMEEGTTCSAYRHYAGLEHNNWAYPSIKQVCSFQLAKLNVLERHVGGPRLASHHSIFFPLDPIRKCLVLEEILCDPQHDLDRNTTVPRNRGRSIANKKFKVRTVIVRSNSPY